VQWLARVIGPIRVHPPPPERSKSGADGAPGPCMREIPVCEDSTIFLSLPSSLFLSLFTLKTGSKKKRASEVEVYRNSPHCLSVRTYICKLLLEPYYCVTYEKALRQLVHTAVCPYKVASALYFVFIFKPHLSLQSNSYSKALRLEIFEILLRSAQTLVCFNMSVQCPS